MAATDPNYFEEEAQETAKFFDLEKLLRYQLSYNIEVVRGADYQYLCYINKEVFAVSLTPMFALMAGVLNHEKFIQDGEPF